MFYLIRATEGQYCGLHGIEAIEIVNCSDYNMANEIGVDMGYELVDSYGFVKDEYQPEDGKENDMITTIYHAALDDFYEAINKYCVMQ